MEGDIEELQSQITTNAQAISALQAVVAGLQGSGGSVGHFDLGHSFAYNSGEAWSTSDTKEVLEFVCSQSPTTCSPTITRNFAVVSLHKFAMVV